MTRVCQNENANPIERYKRGLNNVVVSGKNRSDSGYEKSETSGALSLFFSLSRFISCASRKNRKSADRRSAITENTAAVCGHPMHTVAVDGRSRLAKRRTGPEQKPEGDKMCTCVHARERERGRRARRKRILTGTAVIWRALCFEYLVGKRWTRDDVRFSRGRTVRLRIMLCGGIKRDRPFPSSPREICLRLLVPSKCHNRLCVSEGRLRQVSYCGRSIAVTLETFARDKSCERSLCPAERDPDDRILE